MKKWIVLAFQEYFDGNEPQDTGFTIREAHHINYLVTRIAQKSSCLGKGFRPALHAPGRVSKPLPRLNLESTGPGIGPVPVPPPKRHHSQT